MAPLLIKQNIQFALTSSLQSYIFISAMITRMASNAVRYCRQYFYFSDMKVRVDQHNYLVFDPKIGGRIIELRLSGRLIIRGQHSELGNGNYLMYPWVNRIQKVPYQVEHPYNDSNGLPIHGLYVDSPRNATIFSLAEDSIGIELTPEVKVGGVPDFVETFILSRGKFQQKIKVHNSAEDKIPFCFGYHPYLQIDEENIEDLQIKTDIKTNLALDGRLVTIYPYQRQDIIVKSSETYDSLFQGGTYLQLTNKQGFNIKITSALPYWQIYTPPDGKRIAVEPMSFTGNLYDIAHQGHFPTINEGALEIQAWQQQ